MYVVKPRCKRCNKILREDRTCQNPKCVRYVPDPVPEPEPEPVAPEVPVEEAPKNQNPEGENNGENTSEAN